MGFRALFSRGSMMKRGNQGWSTKPKDGSPAGRPPLTAEQRAGREKDARRDRHIRATDEEYEVIKWFVHYVRHDLATAAKMVNYPEKT